ncbi:MAG: hypothetical protein ACREM2_09935, partial [Vulcanimicrobiaceae bacterium]
MQPARCALLTKAGNASLIVLIVLAGSLRPARADPSLPIVPPAGWRAVPSSFMPNLALTWQNGPSSFAIVTTQISASTSEALHELGVQASESGAKVEKSTTKFVCRSPAVRVDVRKPLAGGALAIVEQAQSLEGNSFLAVYRRPAQLPADPAIVGLLDRFCGVATLAGLAPPPDWRATHRRFLGIWLSPNLSQAITVQQTDPQPDLAQLALGAMSESSGRSLQRIASSSSTLCGLPAVFATFRAATPKG